MVGSSELCIWYGMVESMVKWSLWYGGLCIWHAGQLESGIVESGMVESVIWWNLWYDGSLIWYYGGVSGTYIYYICNNYSNYQKIQSIIIIMQIQTTMLCNPP